MQTINQRLHPVLLLFIFAACLPSAIAQLDGRLMQQPVGVGYMRDMSQIRLFNYLKQLSSQLDVGKSIVQQVTDEQLESLESLNPGVEHPITGVSWHMVQGLIPSFRPLYFQEVKDLAAAKKLINTQKEAYGEEGVLKEEDNDSFRLSMVSSNTFDVPEGMSADDYVKQFSNSSGEGFTNKVDVIEEDGKQKIRQNYSYTQLYRYHDSLLFSSSFDELFSMELPSTDTLTSRVSSANDMGVEANFDRIPAAIKTLGWNMLSSGAGPQLQRRDEEPEVDAVLRKTSLSTGLDIVKSVMFDVDTVDGWLRFANAESDTLKGQLNFTSRRNSGLVTQLDELSSAASRMAPVLRDDSAFTFHTCFRVSKDAAAMLPAASEWFQYQLANGSTGNNSAVLESAAKIGETLVNISQQRDVEFLLKAGYSEQSDGVFYGGLQVGENPDLLESLFRLAIESAPENTRDAFELTSANDMRVLHVKLPSEFTTSIKAQTSLLLTDAFIVHRGPSLWFAIGSNNALAMIQQCIDRCESGGLASRTPIATLHVDAEKWLAYPQDDEVGVGGLLRWLDANEPTFPWNPMSISMGAGSGNPKPTPLLDRAFELGGAQDLMCKAIADKSGVRVDVEMGEAIANYHLARLLDIQDKMINGMLDAAAEELE